MKTRIYFLDNLRTTLIFLVIVLHAGLVYESVLENTWIVVDPVKNSSIGLIRMYLDLFVMFSLFFVSGYFVPPSLKSKGATEFLKSKFKRIIIPWILGVITLIPAYKAIFLYSRGMPQEDWYTYFHIYQRAGADLTVFSNNPAQNWLWFLPVLFLFQVMYMALSKTKISSFKITLKSAVILTAVIGLGYGLLIASLDLRGWYHSALIHFQRERLLIYFMAFLLGALCFRLKVFESTKKNQKAYIWTNVLLTLTLSVFTAVALNFFFNMIDPGRNYYFVSKFIDRVFYYGTAILSMLSFLYILIYVFRFNVNKSNRNLQALNRNSYSVYIIHVIVMGVVALFLVQLHIPAMLKYAILVTMTFLLSNIIVSAYRRLAGNKIVFKVVTACLFAALLFVLINLGKSNGEGQLIKNAIQPTLDIGLHEAALQGDLEAVIQHIQAGSDLNIKEASVGSSPLITAAAFGRTEVAQALVEAGAEVNFKNKDGSTPLHTAAFFCRVEIVELLLSHGAEVRLTDNNGSTALESVSVPYELVEGIYDYFRNTLGPVGLEIDEDYIITTRPIIAHLLQKDISNKEKPEF